MGYSLTSSLIQRLSFLYSPHILRRQLLYFGIFGSFAAISWDTNTTRRLSPIMNGNSLIATAFVRHEKLIANISFAGLLFSGSSFLIRLGLRYCAFPLSKTSEDVGEIKKRKNKL